MRQLEVISMRKGGKCSFYSIQLYLEGQIRTSSALPKLSLETGWRPLSCKTTHCSSPGWEGIWQEMALLRLSYHSHPGRGIPAKQSLLAPRPLVKGRWPTAILWVTKLKGENIWIYRCSNECSLTNDKSVRVSLKLQLLPVLAPKGHLNVIKEENTYQ